MPLTTLELTIRTQADRGCSVDARLTSEQSAAPSVLATHRPVALDEVALRTAIDDPNTYGRLLGIQFFADQHLRDAWTKARAYAATGDLQLRLNLDPAASALHDLRWETLCDPETSQPIALYEHVRLVRTLDSADLTPIIIPSRPELRALVVVSNPSNLSTFHLTEVDVEGEVGRARMSLGDIPTTILGDIAGAAGRATLANLAAHLRDGPHIVLLIAHGTIAAGEPLLWLEQDDGTAYRSAGADLTAAIERLSTCPLLLALLSCQSGGRGYDETLRALGPQLARIGVPAVLGFQGNVAMSTVKTLLPTLITELRRDGRIDRSLAASRAALGPTGPWWQAMLWLRTDGQLWHDGQARPTNREQRLRALIHDHSGFIANRMESFVGRMAELAEIRQCLNAIHESGGYVTVTGQAGQGKSSVLAKIIEELSPAVTPHHFIPLKPGPDHQVGLLRNLLAQLILKHNLAEIYVASDSRPALRDYFAQALREIAAAGRHEIIVIDGLDQIEEDASGVRDLSFLPLEPPPGIVFLIGTRPNDTLKPLELRKLHKEYWLPNLSWEDFGLILQHRGVILELALAQRFYRAMQENALYLDLVARELAQPGGATPEALIAKITDDPDNLFSLSIERLKADRQRWRTLLKPILGLLLAARDPLSRRAIRALIATEDDECREGVQRLGGLLARDGEGRYYLYHLKLNDYLRYDETKLGKEYVFASDEEEAYQQRLADWAEGGHGGLAVIWEEVSGDALEQERRHYGRQHYISHLAAARSYPQLWGVIDAGHYGRDKLRYDPSGRSYIFDLDTVRDAIIASAGGSLDQKVAILSQLWRYSLLRCRLASRADNMSDQIFELMAQLRQDHEAIKLAEVLTEPKRKSEVLALIAIEMCKCQSSDAVRTLARAQQVARDIEQPEARSEAHIAVAKAAVSLDEIDWSRQIYAEAIAAAQAIPSPSSAVRILCNIALLQYAHNRDGAHVTLRVARVIFEAIGEADSRAHALRTIAASMAQAGAFDEATALAQAIDNIDSRASVLSVVAASMAQAGAFDEATALAQAIDNADIRASVLSVVATAMAEAGAFAEATALAQAIDNADSRASALISVGSVLTRVGDRNRARPILAFAHTSAQAIEDASKREYYLSAVASALAQAGAPDEAATLAQTIEDASRRVHTLSAVASTLVQVGHFERARTLLARAYTAAQVIESASSQAYAFSTIVSTLAQAGASDEAIALAQTIEHASSRASAYFSIASAFAQVGHVERARTALSLAYTAALTIDDASIRINLLSTIASSFVQVGAFEQASALAQTIDDAFSRASVLSSIASTLIQAGDTERARSILALAHMAAQVSDDDFSRANTFYIVAAALTQIGAFDQATNIALAIDDAFSRASALFAIGFALIQAGDTERARTILTLSYTTVQNVQDAFSRAHAISTIAAAMAQTGAFDQATSFALAIDEAGSHVHALSAVASALAQAGYFERARALLVLAPTVAKTIDNDQNYTSALSTIAAAFIQADALDQATNLVLATDNAFSRVSILNIIASTLVEIGDFERARTTLDFAYTTTQLIDDASNRASAFCTIASTLAKLGAFDQATNLALAIDDAYNRASGLSFVASALALAGDSGRAHLILDLAYTTAQVIDDPDSRASAYNTIASALAQSGDIEHACTILDLAYTTAQVIDDPDSRASTFYTIAAAFAKLGAFDQAIALALTIDDADNRASIFRAVVSALAKAGRFAELCIIVLRLWRGADTYDYFCQLADLPQGQMIIEARLDRSIPESIAWVQQMLQL